MVLLVVVIEYWINVWEGIFVVVMYLFYYFMVDFEREDRCVFIVDIGIVDICV